MKLIEMIYDNVPRIVIAVLVVYMFFRCGPFFVIITAVYLAVSRIIGKADIPRRPNTKEFIRMIDESGDHHE